MQARRRRRILALLVAFVATRAFLVWLSGFEVYRSYSPDLELYRGWAVSILDEGRFPYRDIAIEYPPASLLPVVLPQLFGDPAGYADRFVLLMLLIDAAAFAGLLATARRTGVHAGAWVWVVAVPVLGPVAYLRLDLLPAAATVLAFERFQRGGWGGGGAWLGLGAAAKLYPAAFAAISMPLVRRWRSLLAGAVIGGLLPLLLFLVAMPALVRNVLGYHSSRGIHTESSWGIGLLFSHRSGTPAVDASFGGVDVVSDLTSELKLVAVLCSLAVLAGAILVARRRVFRDDVGALARVLYAAIAMLLAVGTVFSPQFVLWAAALAACGLAFRGPGPSWPLFAILPVAALTHYVFPFRFFPLIEGDPGALIPLALRNGLLLGAGLVLMLSLASRDRERGAAPAPQDGAERS